MGFRNLGCRFDSYRGYTATGQRFDNLTFVPFLLFEGSFGGLDICPVRV